MALSPADTASRVGYQEVREYLKHRGWLPVPSRRAYAAIFRGPDGGKTEVVVPLERDLADYADAIATIAHRVATVEGRPSEAVLHDFLQPRKDIVRYALRGQSMSSGSVGLLGGLCLLEGAKKSLLASAMTVKRPVRFHVRMSLSEAEAFVAASRIGQTEVGSFVLKIETPHQIGLQQEVGDAPFGRRATQQLFRSTELLTRAIRQDTVDALLLGDPNSSIVSANLCDALVEMMPADESADLRIQCSWSPLLPIPTDTPSDVGVDRNMFETIEQVAQKLRPSNQPLLDTFYGYVTELAGGMSPEGEIRLRVLVEGELVEARAALEGAEYATACSKALRRDERWRRLKAEGQLMYVLDRARQARELMLPYVADEPPTMKRKAIPE